MASLPTGTVTFLFTDIEGSTELVQRLGDRRYAEVLEEHKRRLHDAFSKGNGQEIETQGDAILVAFSRARDAVAAAVAAQRAVMRHAWPQDAAPRIRMGLHTGEPLSGPGGYVGLDVHRVARICGAGYGGQILLSDATQAIVAKDLPEGVSLRDLGEHRLKDLADPQRLFQISAADLLADFPPLRSVGSVLHHNLPSQLTSFIGREREIADVKAMLASARLVTLTGAGGSGKTRLALQVGADLRGQWSDGVWLVELAPIEDPALVEQAVASALGVPEQPGRRLTETLMDSLRPRTLLLLLDNCEHLLAACAHLADSLLQAGPNVRILATSREGLGIAGESLYPVPALPAPDPERATSMEEIARYDAVRLFAARAAAVQPAFRVTPQNARSVARICYRLDGIPLAIELAAVRVKTLAVDQISGRLDDRFGLLTGGSRTAVPRQQTLRATMDWSYELLSRQERTLLQRLSVFAGGWTLEAAEAVCSERHGVGSQVLDLLTQLVDKSLVTVELQDGEARYHMLETVRQYGRDRIVESGKEMEARTRHQAWYLAFAEQADQKRRGVDREGQLDRLEREHDNLRAALEWSKARGESEATLRLAAALGRFWWRRGHWSEGRAWLEGALAKESASSVSVKARALHGAGVLAWVQGDFDRATTLLEESIALSRTLRDKHGIITSLIYLSDMSSNQSKYERAVAMAEECITLCKEIGDRESIAEVLNTLGNVALDQGNYDQAAASFEESLMLSRELGLEIEIAYALYHLGEVARLRGNYEGARLLLEESLLLGRQLRDEMCIAQTLNTLGLVTAVQGDYGRSTALLEQSLALCRRLGDKWTTAISLNHLGLVAWYQGDDGRAAALLTQSLTLRRDQVYKRGIAASLNDLGRVVRRQGDSKRAAALFEESAALCRELGDKAGMAKSLEGLAGCAAEQRQLGRATRLFGAACRAREAIGAPLPPTERPEYDQRVASTRAGFGETAFNAAWAEGGAMTLEQAIEYALQEGTPAEEAHGFPSNVAPD